MQDRRQEEWAAPIFEEKLNVDWIIQRPYSRLSMQDRAFLEELGNVPPLGSLPVEQERDRMRQAQAYAPEDSPVSVEEFNASACPVYILRPPNAGDTRLPIMFYFHGGGWVLGDLQTHRKLVCELAIQSQCAVVFVEYPRAPESPFPAPIQACTSAAMEVLRASSSLRLRSERFLLAGDSSGGNLVMAVTLMLREKRAPMPGGLALLYPVADHAMITVSCREFENNSNLSLDAMAWFWGHYLPDPARRSNWLASPLRTGSELLAGLPPTLILTCEYDILRDEGEELAELLVESGVEVTAVRWLGALHGFLVTERLSSSRSAKSCIAWIAQFCRETVSAKAP